VEEFVALGRRVLDLILQLVDEVQIVILHRLVAPDVEVDKPIAHIGDEGAFSTVSMFSSHELAFIFKRCIDDTCSLAYRS
jgi:hypothetical protein